MATKDLWRREVPREMRLFDADPVTVVATGAGYTFQDRRTDLPRIFNNSLLFSLHATLGSSGLIRPCVQ